MAFIDKMPENIARVREAARQFLENLVQESDELPEQGATFYPRELMEGDVLSSEEFNFEQQALWTSLSSVYFQASEIGTTRLRHENILIEALKKTKGAILKAISDLRTFSFLQQNPGYNDVRFVDFNTTRNLTGYGPAANLDVDSRSLRSATATRSEARIVHPSRGRAQVSVQHLGGGEQAGLIQGFDTSHMFDGNETTYWVDVITTDAPIVQEYQKSDGQIRNIYGLVTELTIRLSEVSETNCINILPFGEFPLEILDIAYKTSPVEGGWTQVPGFVATGADLDWHGITFPPIKASVIRVTLSQENYIRGVYHLPLSRLYSTDILEKSIAETYAERVGTTGVSSTEIAKVAVQPELLGYLEALDEFKSEVDKVAIPLERVREYEQTVGLLDKIAKVLVGPNDTLAANILEPMGGSLTLEDTLVEISKVEYLVGIRTLDISYQTYSPVSHYASPEFDTIATPVEISLITTEKHPVFKDEQGQNYHLTSLEYELDLGEGYRKPILPSNQQMAKEELISIDRHSKTGWTRFLPIQLVAVLRKNGTRVPVTNYTFSIDETLNLGKVVVSSDYSSTAVYTITYTPNTSAFLIELPSLINSTPIHTPEVFDGTDNNSSISLSYIPFIAYEIVNNEEEWIGGEGLWEYNPSTPGAVTIDGIEYSSSNPTYEPISILVNDVKARNITNYISVAQPAFTVAGQESLVYEYFHVGRRVYFNKPVRDSQISVEYNWLAQYIQLIASLRCLKRASPDLTPILDDFTIKIRTTPL